jgi:transposase
MFIRVNTTPNSPRRSIQVVESKRIGDKIKQKIVRYVGIAHDDDDEQKLKDMAQDFINKMAQQAALQEPQLDLFGVPDANTASKRKTGRPTKKKLEDILPPGQVSLDDIVEQHRIIEGVHEVGNHVYDYIGYDKLLDKKRDNNLLRDLVLARLSQPASKRKTQRYLANQFGKEYDLDAIYRLMDKLYPLIGKIKQITFDRAKALFPETMDLILFDVTTLYFESIEVDELRAFGYSKDHRFNTTQVVLALATNGDGLPVGYELFEGNKAEVGTLVAALENWKKLFNINSVCFVGDRAMFCDKNIALLEKHGHKYIIAAKLRKLGKKMHETIFDEQNYYPTILASSLAWVGEFDYKGQRLIVSYKTQRAIKDMKDRQKILDKLQKNIGTKGPTKKLITNQGVKKYTTTDATAQTIIDVDKVALDAQWDGLHGVITNIRDDSAACIIARYCRLWVIEESFRINKHNLEMRPIFHWKPERIHAHIAICYMTFALLRHLEYRVNLTQKISVEMILEELSNVEASIHQHKKTKDLYRVPGYLNNNARKIYKAFDLIRSQDAEVYLP